MQELEKLYTVEDIANMTGLTTRTIRNYLKDGSLEGKKIGGQWRFNMKNIEKLFNNGNVSKDIQDDKKQQVLDFIDGVNTDMNGNIQICTIVDYYCDNIESAKQMSDKLIMVINHSNEAVQSGAKYSYEYVEKEGKARFTLFGNPSFIIDTLKLLEQ
ncbi:helix-turn-helix domain-containing protein [Clostridium sp. YIM B02505]|uniref:Helix-turn-helix domain-containing protein n=1 Tax=Clostridium yunnanense TaxID=2800325 RepID=A0ABS1EMW1_9CLOT|nr:helix-turn-helix domain-containing protein [Clostridium yunnanense]MBK1810701.1 helix-turn-helix domain-containing protein [Clostridium yunnanense]